MKIVGTHPEMHPYPWMPGVPAAMVEVPPRRHLINIVDEVWDERTDEYEEFDFWTEIPLPYLYVVNSNVQNFAFVRNSPVESLDDELCLAPLSTVSHNGMSCNSQQWKDETPEESTLRFLRSSFNLSWYTNPPPALSASYPVALKQLSEMSIEDVLKISWVPATNTPRISGPQQLKVSDFCTKLVAANLTTS